LSRTTGQLEEMELMEALSSPSKSPAPKRQQGGEGRSTEEVVELFELVVELTDSQE
jgi:hypothetical protein